MTLHRFFTEFFALAVVSLMWIPMLCVIRYSSLHCQHALLSQKARDLAIKAIVNGDTLWRRYYARLDDDMPPFIVQMCIFWRPLSHYINLEDT